MSQNNFQHYSDLAEYSIFNPSNTPWPNTVKDVQSALELIGPWARTDKGLPVASTTVQGVLSFATQAEVDVGTVGNKAVSPATLKATVTRPVATRTVLGLTQYANDSEATGFTLDTRAITPKSLGLVFNSKNSTQTSFGTIKLATPAMGTSGTDDTTACTPKRVKEMIATFSPAPLPDSLATETVLGSVKLTTSAQVQQGTLHDGYAVSPKSLMGAKSTESLFGVIRLATDSEVSAGTANNLAVSPKGLLSLKAGGSKFGLVKLSNAPGDAQTAARADSVVFKTTTVNGKPLSSNVTLTANDLDTYTRGESDGRFMPSNRQVGNITRVEGATYLNYRNGGTGTWQCQSPWQGTSKLGANIVCKFERNNDGYDNRIFQFYILVNGQRQGGMLTLNIENTKGGRNGHSWRFEAYASGNFLFSGIPPLAVVQLEPVEASRVLHVDILMTFCTD